MSIKIYSTKRVLPLIVIAQFACTSLWFAGNAILPELQREFNLSTSALGDLTSAVQFGFILGTLVFALLGISDRYSPSKVFFVCALLGAVVNFSITITPSSWSLYVLRGFVGFFLAGIYPVGMKISADYHEKGLGKALGYLVGALVVGTALPHLLRTFSKSLDWHFVIYATSVLATIGGCLVFLLVPDGPFRKSGNKLNLSLCISVFKENRFRAAAFGYFGHMWELYTLWAFIPFILAHYSLENGAQLNLGLWSFVIIAMGGPACVIGGYHSKNVGSAKTAFVALLISGLCCLLSVFSLQLPTFAFLSFLMIWGMAVVADSPQFSAMVAQYAPAEARGTALTIVNSIGFAITILSLQVINALVAQFDPKIAFIFLAIGPVLGLLALKRANITE